MSRLERLLRPKSIAVIGGGAFGTNVVRQSLKMGFAGEIWPVHPTRDEVEGLRAYRSVGDLPGAPDATFIGVNRHLTIEMVGALRQRGAGGAVCFASGFRETGAYDADGDSLQERLLEAAGGMPIIGPNCYGLINYADGALLWPDQHGGIRLADGGRGAAIITQSSNIAINMTMQARGLPVAYIMTAGNQAQTGLSEMALGLIEDERVSVLGLHIEGFDSVAGFEALATRARLLKKPIVAMKIGRSEQARAGTISHTASLAGSDAASDAFLRRLGTARLDTIPSFLEALKLLHGHGPLSGYRLSSMSCSGGEASVMADSAEGRKAHFPQLTDAHRARVKATLGPLVAVANPLDYHTFIWNDEPAMTATFGAMASGGFDLNMLVLDFPRRDRCSDADWWTTLRAFENGLKAHGAKGAIVASLPENLPEDYVPGLIERGMVPLYGIAEALDAVEAAAFVGEAWRKAAAAIVGSAGFIGHAGAEPPLSVLPDISTTRGEIGSIGAAVLPATLTIGESRADGSVSPLVREMPGRAERGATSTPLDEAMAKSLLAGSALDEASAKSLLSGAGVSVPAGRRVSTPDEAARAADEIGYPVALKALGVAHKSEMGAVRLNLRDAASVRTSATGLSALGSGLYVERMVEGGVAELIVGFTRDPLFGQVMTLGSGGVLVELLKDFATLLLPVSGDEVETALRGLKLFPLLDGYRGRPKADVAAATSAVLALAAFVQNHAGEIEELDINPLIVCAEGQGAWVADALLVGAKSFTTTQSARLAGASLSKGEEIGAGAHS